jgi:glutamate 5-kinase
MHSVVKHARRIVVKVGSSLVTAEGRGLDHAALSRWAEQIAALTAQGKEVVLVSSGAIAEGIARLGWKKRPKAVNELQAAAAVGQMGWCRPTNPFSAPMGCMPRRCCSPTRT